MRRNVRGDIRWEAMRSMRADIVLRDLTGSIHIIYQKSIRRVWGKVKGAVR